MTPIEIATPNLRGSCVTVQNQLHGLFRLSTRPPSFISRASELEGLSGVETQRRVANAIATTILFPNALKWRVKGSARTADRRGTD